jgi:hypothetical protein
MEQKTIKELGKQPTTRILIELKSQNSINQITLAKRRGLDGHGGNDHWEHPKGNGP